MAEVTGRAGHGTVTTQPFPDGATAVTGPRRAALAAVTACLAAASALGGTAAIAHATPSEAAGTTGTPAVGTTVTATVGADAARLTDGYLGFSVESADLAHGFLTSERMAQRLRTLGDSGVIRVGGYSMDLVWPAFGAWSDAPPPPEAIGGVVDQGDLDGLKRLLDDSGWTVTLGLPLKAVIDPAEVRNPARDPSPAVTLDQAVAEVEAAYRTLGDALVGVEIGNEYDHVTLLSGDEMWQTMKRYKAAIDEAVPLARVKLVGPSANTSRTNTRLDEFVTAVAADGDTNPQQVLGELASHWYPWSHCGNRTVTIEQLMSPQTHLHTRAKVAGMMAISERLHDTLPSTVNESNSASCSGMPEVSDAYAAALWSLDHLMLAAREGADRLQFHTNTAAICGDFKPRNSAEYPISYRYYGAFCADDAAALVRNELSATPLYYGLWAFAQVPAGRFVELDLGDEWLDTLRGYGVMGEDGSLTVVLINVGDPAAGSPAVDVQLRLPSSYRTGHAVTLASSDPAGLASLDAGRITLGGAQVSPTGLPDGPMVRVPVTVDQRAASVSLTPGTAQVVTFAH